MKKIARLTQILLCMLIAMCSRASVQSFNPCESVVQTKCNSQGLYKGGKSKLQAQLDDINSILRTNNLVDNINVYPNPTSNVLNIEYKLENEETAIFTIYDILGNKVKEIAIKPNTQKAVLDINTYAQGIYTYKFKKSNGTIFSGKIVKD